MSNLSHLAHPPDTHSPLDTHDNLVWAPELASVRLLQHTLTITRLALLAQYPTLADLETYCGRTGPSTLRAARALLHKSFTLQESIQRYTATVHSAINPSPDIDQLF